MSGGGEWVCQEISRDFWESKVWVDEGESEWGGDLGPALWLGVPKNYVGVPVWRGSDHYGSNIIDSGHHKLINNNYNCLFTTNVSLFNGHVMM